jgi:hypothetical protein
MTLEFRSICFLDTLKPPGLVCLASVPLPGPRVGAITPRRVDPDHRLTNKGVAQPPPARRVLAGRWQPLRLNNLRRRFFWVGFSFAPCSCPKDGLTRAEERRCFLGTTFFFLTFYAWLMRFNRFQRQIWEYDCAM